MREDINIDELIKYRPIQKPPVKKYKKLVKKTCTWKEYHDQKYHPDSVLHAYIFRAVELLSVRGDVRITLTNLEVHDDEHRTTDIYIEYNPEEQTKFPAGYVSRQLAESRELKRKHELAKKNKKRH